MNIIGCDIFGLKDCVSLSGKGFEEEIFCRDKFDSLVDAVLPEDRFGLVKTGEDAEAERIHTGLAWPPESKVSYENSFYLRRVPISMAWKILVESGDRSASWDIGKGVIFPVEKIIAKHIEQKIKQAREKIISEENNHEYRSVIAIPDHLDEFGKEAILRALPEGISEKTDFLWRPIAATLAWIDKYKKDISAQDMDNAWVLVGYLGSDGIEFTPLRLTNRQQNDVNFIVPIRDRPTIPPGPTGIDWQTNVIENLCNVSKDDPGAFWQAFTDFPELWLALSQSPWDESKLPRPWSKKDNWDLWMPEEEVRDKIWSIKVGESEILRNLLTIGLDKKTDNYDKTQNLRRGIGIDWSSHIRNEFSSVFNDCPKGKLLGIIACGPLTSSKVPSWISESTSVLKKHGLVIEESDYLNSSMKLWLDCSQKSIAQGTRIFGHRLLNGQPTYFDTLPALETLANINNDIRWISLIEPGEHSGGELYKTSIIGKFRILDNESTLKFYLKKEDKDWREEYSPYRSGKINFKSVEHEGTPVDIHVEMSPTKGMARIELVPSNKRLGIKNIEYSKMKSITEADLPIATAHWPDTIKIEISTSSLVFRDDQLFDVFLNEDVNSNSYFWKLDNLKIYLTQQDHAEIDGRYKFVNKIDQDGKAGSKKGQEIIDKVRLKLNNDFQKIISQNMLLETDIQKIVSRGAWLWGSTPKSIVEYLEEFFNHAGPLSYGGKWNNFADAASRCFTNPTSYRILFKSIRSRIEAGNRFVSNPFPIQSSRAIEKILKYREDGPDGMDGNTAKIFVKSAVQNIEKQVKRDNFSRLRSHQKFWRDVLLFFVLMRFRINQKNFLDAVQDRDQFNKVYECLEKAYQLTNKTSFITVRKQIEEFQHKRGNKNLINVIDSLAESNEENIDESIISEPQPPSNIIPAEESTAPTPESNVNVVTEPDLDLEDLERKLEEAEADLEDAEGGHDSYAIELIKDDIEYLEGKIEKIKNQN